MNVTRLQAHVLANLDRVVPIIGKYGSARPRYQLDGKECTAQITGLMVHKLIAAHSNGDFRRLSPSVEKKDRVGDRQAPLAGSIEAIRASLSSPGVIRMIRAGKQ